MGDLSGVEVVHPLQDLLDELRGLLLAQRLLLRQEVEQLPSRDPETQTPITHQSPEVTAKKCNITTPVRPGKTFLKRNSRQNTTEAFFESFSLVSDLKTEDLRDSQLQDEHHIRPVLVDVVQRDDVGMLNLLQDVDLPLDLLPPHSSRARHALTLLDELGGKFQTRALLSALFDDGKLPADVQKRREK